MWPLCRYCARQSLADDLNRRAVWFLSAAFLVFTLAWGMTLRPEPFVALLSLASLAAMVRFSRAPHIWTFAAAVVATVFALAAHPTGLVALAPLIACIPNVVRAVREKSVVSLGSVAMILTSGVALSLVLLTLHSDITHRLREIRVIRTGELHGESFWDEYLRYTMFEDWGGGTTLRRLSLALMLLTVGANADATISRRTERLPTWSLGVGLLLLAFVPSKWPWHFGALGAVAAVALTIEFDALVSTHSSRTRPLRLVAALALTSVAGLWAWTAPGTSQSPFGLQSISWQAGFNPETWIAVVMLLPAIALLARRLTSGLRAVVPDDPPISLVAWATCGLCVGAVGITLALLSLDAVRAPWTPARQNLSALVGRPSCGLADQLSGSAAVTATTNQSTATLIRPGHLASFSCALTPRIMEGLIEVPTFVIAQEGTYAILILESPFAVASDLGRLRRVGRGPRGIEVFRVQRDLEGFARADPMTIG